MKKLYIAVLAIIALIFLLMPVWLHGQEVPIVVATDTATKPVTDALTDAGVVIGPLMVVCAILKHAVPAFPNRLIPLATMILGVLGYMLKTGNWSDGNAWFQSFLVSASATGIHSGIKNSFQSRGETPASGGTGILKVLFIAMLLGVLSVGCAKVPATRIKFSPGGGLDLTSPKQFVGSNVVATLNSNGTFVINAGYIESKNDLLILQAVLNAQVEQLKVGVENTRLLIGTLLQSAK